MADNARALAEEAAAYAAEGFRAMKMKVGFGLAEDVRCVRAVREAIGPDRLLAMDANQGYRAGQAMRLGRTGRGLGSGLVRGARRPRRPRGLLQVQDAVRDAGRAGEAEYERRGFHDLCARQAMDIAQPDVGGCGGFTEAWRLAALAAAPGITVYPHVWGTAVVLAASLQLAAALPPNPPALISSEPLFELDRTPNPLRDELAGNSTQARRRRHRRADGIGSRAGDRSPRGRALSRLSRRARHSGINGK